MRQQLSTKSYIPVVLSAILAKNHTHPLQNNPVFPELNHYDMYRPLPPFKQIEQSISDHCPNCFYPIKTIQTHCYYDCF